MYVIYVEEKFANSNLFYHYSLRSQWYCMGVQSSYCGVMYTVPVQAT